MDELEALVAEMVTEATRRNHLASGRMYSALFEIARTGAGAAKDEAVGALRYRNRQ